MDIFCSSFAPDKGTIQVKRRDDVVEATLEIQALEIRDGVVSFPGKLHPQKISSTRLHILNKRLCSIYPEMPHTISAVVEAANMLLLALCISFHQFSPCPSTGLNRLQ